MRPIFPLAMVVVLAACGGRDAEIAIGTAGPFSQNYGLMSRRGAELAVKQANAAGGIDGRRVRLVAQDDSASGAVAVRVAERFVADPSVVAVVGHVNSGAMVMASHVYDGRLAAVATAASSTELTGISRWVFRTITSDSANAIELARHATAAGFRRAAILYENDAYGRGLASLLRQHFAGEIVSVDPIASAPSDLEPFVSFYRLRRPDVVFVAGTEVSGITLLREARRQQLRTQFVGGDGWIGVAADTAAAEGVIVGTPFTPADPRPEVRAFVDAFRREYRREPDGNAALAYDAARLVLRAIDEQGTDREAVRDWLAGLTEETAFPGVTGPIRFHTTGDRLGSGFVMTRVRNGTLRVEGGA